MHAEGTNERTEDINATPVRCLAMWRKAPVEMTNEECQRRRSYRPTPLLSNRVGVASKIAGRSHMNSTG